MARVVASDGVALYAELHGEGPPLLLSCGMCTTCVNFRPQVRPLVAAGWRVVLWDYRGHGRSDSPASPEAYSMEQVLSDLERVLEASGQAGAAAPAVLGGHSFGGLASLHLALRRPERVRALLLFASGPGFKKPEAQGRWAEQVERTARFLETRGLRAFVDGPAGASAVGLRPELPAARAAADAIAAQDPRGVASFARRVAGRAPPVIDELSRVDVPALVLVGEQDEPYRAAADVMAARLPRAEKVVIPGAGHLPNLERAEAFDAAVLDFLRRLPSAPTGA